MSSGPEDPLKDVEAFVFDVWGTVVNWRKGVSDHLRAYFGGKLDKEDWVSFTNEWRVNYYKNTKSIAGGGAGSINVDVMHRSILDKMLETPRWSHLAAHMDHKTRQDIVLFWHFVPGWPDTTEGLYALKKQAIIGTLSNGSIRTLVDMAKHADLPWDVLFSSELLQSYKPNPKMYLGALQYLGLQPHQCAMVAAHIYDLRAAATHGMKTVFVWRPEEPDAPLDVKSKREGGEVDVYAKSFTELAELLQRAKAKKAQT